MVHQPRNRHTLLLAAAQHILPLLAGVPAALAVRQVAEAGEVEGALQVVLALALLAHVGLAVRVDDLVAEGADAEVGPLRQEHDAVLAVLLGRADEAAVGGPQAGDNARNGALADAVGPGDLSRWKVSDEIRFVEVRDVPKDGLPGG